MLVFPRTLAFLCVVTVALHQGDSSFNTLMPIQLLAYLHSVFQKVTEVSDISVLLE